MLALIDANVILRHLLGDHEQMSATATEIIRAGAQTTPEVMAEVVYVLKGVYKVPLEEISSVLLDFLDSVFMEEKAEVMLALKLFGEASLDFVDCLLIARNRISGIPVFTFDKKMNSYLKPK